MAIKFIQNRQNQFYTTESHDKYTNFDKSEFTVKYWHTGHQKIPSKRSLKERKYIHLAN